MSKYVGTIKGKTAIYLLNMFRKMRKKIYMGKYLMAKNIVLIRAGKKNNLDFSVIIMSLSSLVDDLYSSVYSLFSDLNREPLLPINL